jgi:PEP-CTERM motif
MKTNLTKLICGLALLGAAAAAPAQTNLLASWSGVYNASSQTFPYAAGVVDPSSVSSAFMSYVGLTPVNSSPDGTWGVSNHSSTLDIATAPYLQWTINLTAADTFSDLRLYVTMGENQSKPPSFFNTELRSSLDNYSASLGDYQGGVGTNFLVSLEPPLTGSVTVRLYAYNVPVSATAGYVVDTGVDLLGVVAPVPEPSTLALSVMGGLGGLLLFRRRK